jgi:hypothetical protein
MTTAVAMSASSLNTYGAARSSSLDVARIGARRPDPAVPGRAELVRHAWRRLLKGNLRDA